MKNPFTDIFHLFFPKVCAVCGEPLPEEGGFICTRCRLEIPLTGFWHEVDNPVARKFHGHLPVVNASAFFFFVYESDYRGLIHKFKYQGGWRFAEQMGRWYGAEMKSGGLYGSVDVVVPVPLHFRKQLSRGYNQSDYIAKGIASALGKDVDSRSVARTVHNESQTKRSSNERWDNVQGIFSVRKPEDLKGKHILLVDDVLTTGATIISCGEAILKAVPDCHISIAALAVSRGEQ